MRADCPRILSHECATLALLDTFSKGVTRKTFETFRRTLLHTLAGADPENSERGGRYNCLLKAPFYFAENSIKKQFYISKKKW